jgi:transposase
MTTHFYIGVDVSKATLDWAVTDGKTLLLQTQSVNSQAGIKATLKVIKALPGFGITEAVCCMEHTGLYCAHLLSSLYKIHLPIWLESSLQIKKAGGAPRGVVYNGVRMMQLMQSVSLSMPAVAYHFRFRDKLHLWQPPRPVLQKLAALSVLRQRLLLVHQQMQQPIKEQQRFVEPSLQRQLIKSCQASLNAIKVDLKNVDKQIQELIQADDYLKKLFDLVTSVPGVGIATATELLVATEEFKSINKPKKLAASAVRLPCRRCPLRLSIW